MVIPDQRVEFTLSPAEAAVLRRLVPRMLGALPAWYYITQILVLSLQFVTLAMNGRAHVTLWSSVMMWTASLGLVIALIAWARAGDRDRRVPAHGVLEISPRGLSGTLDGRLAEIGWPDVQSVRIAGSCVVLVAAKAKLVLAIPIAAFSNFDAFWCLVDDRLVAKRGPDPVAAGADVHRTHKRGARELTRMASVR